MKTVAPAAICIQHLTDSVGPGGIWSNYTLEPGLLRQVDKKIKKDTNKAEPTRITK